MHSRYPLHAPEQLSVFLRALRKSQGLTQRELSKRLGVSIARISTIEKNPGRECRTAHVGTGPCHTTERRVLNARRRVRSLDVWMNGELVGVWYPSRSGVPVLEYDAQWLQSPRCRPLSLSLSLPLLPGNEPHRGDLVTRWFDNLLPDSRIIRERVRARFRLDSLDAFALLAEIGRDCVGAVQLMPAGAEFRMSIAGAQEKTALLRRQDQWYLPHGTTPTTHLLKLPLGLVGNLQADLGESVENEWLCMQLLGELGLPVPPTEIAQFSDDRGAVKALVVERFDREVTVEDISHAPWIIRLPQKDLRQATGTPASRKYESDGGPTLYDCLELLRAGNDAEVDMLTFVKAQLAFWLLAAPDGHTKKFSIFLRRDGYIMTPLYDVMSTWPIVGTGANEWAYPDVKRAMALRGSRSYRHLNCIAARHWRALAERTGVTEAFEAMVRLVADADGALTRLEHRLPAGFPPQVWERIAQGVRAQVARFQMGLDTSIA